MLAREGETRDRCLAAERRTGEVGGWRYELLWIPALELPAWLDLRGHKHHRLELVALEGAAAAPAAFAGGGALDRIDFADIGDREDDSVVAAWIAQGFVEHPVGHDDH